MPSGKKHTFIRRTLENKSIFYTPSAGFINQIIISNGTYVAANSTYTRNEPNGAFARADGLGSIYWNGSEWYIFSADIGNVAVNYNNLNVNSWEPHPFGNSSNIIAVNI